MMLIMSFVCLLKTLNRYLRLAESLCFINYVQSYMLQTLEENLYHTAHFRGYRFFHGFRRCQLFPGLFQIVPE